MPIQLLPTAVSLLKKQLSKIADENVQIYKDVSDWTNADLANAYNSPLYKYNKKLQDKTREYIQTKWK